MEPEESSFRNLLLLVGLFGAFLGLKINMNKSLLLGMGVDDVIMSSIAELMGCEVGAWPTTYLGLPLGGNLVLGAFGNL